jgi:DNA repair photolyase
MQYKYANFNTILKRITKVDTLFVGDYTLDPYQNCEFRCKYCDSSFEDVIYIKSNSLKLLEKEIKKIENGMIIVGSVIDPYQKIEKNQKITRNLLKIIKDNNFSAHILTKSDLVLRDIDIISEIERCIVTISITSLDKSILNILEKNVPSSTKRMKIIHKFSEIGIKTGLAILPILPFIVEKELEDIIKIAKNNEVQYLLHKYLELKGDQKKIFLKLLKKINPKLINKYIELYNDKYMPNKSYILKIKDIIDKHCKNFNIPTHI